MVHLLAWFNQSRTAGNSAPLLPATLCHFWFVILYPFNDGNGRIPSALTDLALADNQAVRLYAR
nr:Fic family protein [Acerihabitans arboris]